MTTDEEEAAAQAEALRGGGGGTGATVNIDTLKRFFNSSFGAKMFEVMCTPEGQKELEEKARE